MNARPWIWVGISWICLSTGCRAPLSQGSLAEEAADLDVLDQSEGGLVVDFTAPTMERISTTLDARPYIRLRMAGMSHEAEEGFPEIPFQNYWIAVPQGYQPIGEVIEASDPEFYQLEHPVAYKDRREVHNGRIELVTPDLAAYREASSRELFVIGAPSYFGADLVAKLTIRPVFYDPVAGQLRLIRRAKIAIRFVKDSDASEAPTSYRSSGVLRSLVLNPDLLTESQNRMQRDLIIADQSYQQSIEDYAEWKRSMNRSVDIVYVNVPSVEDVKRIIRERYRSEDPPTHTLLVGSIDQIPSHRWNSIWTDYPYAHLDRGDVPDISLGRIPAQSNEELDAYLAKAKSRRSGRRDVDSFLLTAGSDRRLGCPQNVDRIGGIIRDNRRNARMTKLYKANGASQDQIIDGYNANPNIIVYDGHGDHTGMTEIPLRIDHLSRLSNSVYPIVLDIACLNAHWPSSGASRRNFAESILMLSDYGVAGIVAAGGNSGGHSFFQRIIRFAVDRIAEVPESTEFDPVLDEFGQIFLAAKVQSGSFDNNMFNFYGDPALAVFE